MGVLAEPGPQWPPPHTPLTHGARAKVRPPHINMVHIPIGWPANVLYGREKKGGGRQPRGQDKALSPKVARPCAGRETARRAVQKKPGLI